MSLTTSAYVEQSAKFASLIQSEYKNKAGRIDKGVQRQSIWVLWRTAMPSILTEVGFLTNPIEEKFLGSEKGQTYMASAIFRAFRNYKNDVEGKNEKFDDEIENQEALENENEVYKREHPNETLLIEEEKKDSLNEQTVSENKDSEKYEVAIKLADEKLKERMLDEAKSFYNQALVIKKDDSYAKQKLSEISKLEAEIKKAEDDKAKANETQNKQYNDLIAKADKLIAEKKWEDAKKKYQEALIAKPGEKYSKQKIKEIEEKQAELSAAENDTTIVNPKDLIKNYAGQNKKDTTKKAPLVKAGIEFKIQFASSDKEIEATSPKLKGLENVAYYKSGNILKYTAGNFTKPEEAAKYQTKVRELGYKDAFVVAFKNGERIDYKEALKLTSSQ
jgi:hypothetical protein